MIQRHLLPLLLAVPLAAQVNFTPDKIDIQVDGKPFTTLHFGAEVNKPYLAPLLSASGKNVTRRFPMEKVEGESHDHLHHRGLWFSYDDVNGVKFWEDDPSYTQKNIGRIATRSVEWKDGPKTGVLTAVFDWNDPQGKTILVEHRVMTAHSDPTLRVLDFDITLTAAQPVVFGDTKEGAFAIRLADALNERKTGKMTGPDGEQGMKDIWGKRLNWVDYSGEIEGEKLGVTIFDHPSNPRHPTYWHSRDYGLFALNPFGRHAFDPKAEESNWKLPQGQSLRFRWRVLIHPGDAQTVHLADMYREYSAK
jgi:hypothetical protein